MTTTIGWDIGGAHLKAVLVDEAGIAQHALQLPCPLWRGLHELELAFGLALSQLPHHCVIHAVTMTGELVDAFQNRADGVMQIAQVAERILDSRTQFYAGVIGFVDLSKVQHYANKIASANWHASAMYIATQISDGLLIDVGSTTADFVMIRESKPQTIAYSDAERLQTSELLYTGAYRTPVMAVAQRAPFAGEWVHVCAEHFATMADVYRITGDCRDDEEMSNTADGKDKTLNASITRLARMIGRDAEDGTIAAWRELAHYFKHAQIGLLKDAVFRHLSRYPASKNFHLIGAGAGDFLVKTLAQQLGFNDVPVADLIVANNQQTQALAAVCLPAYAVARLCVQ